MRHIIITIAIALASLSLSAKEISKNPDTGMVLSEIAGQYTVTGKGGTIILGNKEQALKFMHAANSTMFTDVINHIFNFGDDQFQVGRDDKGLYIIKVGVGGVKLRQSDIFWFGSALGVKSIIESDTAKKLCEATKSGLNKLGKKLTEITE